MENNTMKIKNKKHLIKGKNYCSICGFLEGTDKECNNCKETYDKFSNL